MVTSKTQSVPLCCINIVDDALRFTVGIPTWIPDGIELPLAYDKNSCVLWAYTCDEGVLGWVQVPEHSNVTIGDGPPLEPPGDCEMNLYMDRNTRLLYIWDGSQFNIFSELAEPIVIAPAPWDVEEIVGDPLDAGITIDITALGLIEATGDNTGQLAIEDWGITPPSECEPTEYEVQGVIVGDAPLTAPAPGFNPVSAGNLLWYWQQTIVGSQTPELTLTIQPIDTPLDAVTKVIDLMIEVTGTLDPFIMDFDVPADKLDMYIPSNLGAVTNATIDWGDGTVTTVTDSTFTDPNRTHTYAGAGIYRVTIDGPFTSLFFNEGVGFGGVSTLVDNARRNLIKVVQWGNTGFDTLNQSFYGCFGLLDLPTDVSDLGAVTDMDEMFKLCGFVNIDLSHFDMTAVNTIQEMFASTFALQTLDTTGWDTSNITSMHFTFHSTVMPIIDLTHWNVSNVTDFREMFSGNVDFVSLNITNWNCESATTLAFLISGTTLPALDLTGVTTSLALTDMQGMFNGCWSLGSIDVSGLTTTNVTTMNLLFNECRTITSINMTGFSTANVVDMSNMFGDCRALPTLNVSMLNTISVTNMDNMFRDMLVITSLDVSTFDTSSVTRMISMFNGSVSLTSIIGIENFDISNVTTMLAFLNGVTLSTITYDAMLINYEAQTVQPGVTADFGGCKYTTGGAAEAARTSLIGTHGWVITDGGPV